MKLYNLIRGILLCCSIIFLLVGVNLIVTKSVQAKDMIKVGDYIDFGSYNNSTIHWRVIYINNEGEPLLWSDDNVTYCAYDGISNTSLIDPDSHDWKTSNIRQWLNSRDQAIQWVKTPPNNESVTDDNSYADESGFLYGFSDQDYNMIQPTAIKTILNSEMKVVPDGGSEWFDFQDEEKSLDEVIKNYDLAYYESSMDNVFILSIDELYKYVYTHDKNLAQKSFLYWLRDPSHSLQVGSYITNGYYKNSYAGEPIFVSNSLAIYPALYLKSTASFSYGNGTEESPYSNVEPQITDITEEDTDISDADNVSEEESSYISGKLKWTAISDLQDIALTAHSTNEYYSKPHTVNVLNNQLVAVDEYNKIYQVKQDKATATFISTFLYDFGKEYSVQSETSKDKLLCTYFYGNKLFYTNKKYILCKENLYYDPIDMVNGYPAKFLKNFVTIDKSGNLTSFDIKITLPMKKHYSYSVVDIYYADKKFNMIVGSHNYQPGLGRNLFPECFILYTSSNLKDWKKVKVLEGGNYFNKKEHEDKNAKQVSLRKKYKTITQSIDKKIKKYIPLDYATTTYYNDGSISQNGDIYSQYNITEIRNDKATYIQIDYKVTNVVAKVKTHLGDDFDVVDTVDDSYTIPVVLKIEKSNKYKIVSPADIKHSCEQLYSVIKARENVKEKTKPYINKLNSYYKGKTTLSSANILAAKKYIIKQNSEFINTYNEYQEGLYIKNFLTSYNPMIMSNGDLYIMGDISSLTNKLSLDSNWKNIAAEASKLKGYIDLSNILLFSDEENYSIDDISTFNMEYINDEVLYGLDKKHLYGYFYFNNAICATSGYKIWISEIIK